MRLLEYEVICDDDSMRFAEKILNKTRRNWVPIGGISVITTGNYRPYHDDPMTEYAKTIMYQAIGRYGD